MERVPTLDEYARAKKELEAGSMTQTEPKMNSLQKSLRDALFFLVEETITDPQVLAFTKQALEKAPNYFWTINASTSGKYHHGESLTEHVIAAMTYGKEHIRMLTSWWDEQTISIFFSGLALHDLYRCGYEGREAVDDDGKFRTDYMHPLYVAKELERLEMPTSPKGQWVKGKWASSFKWFKKWQKAVSGHMGPWSPIPESSPMNDNVLSLRFHVFLVDYVVSRGCQKTVMDENTQLIIQGKKPKQEE